MDGTETVDRSQYTISMDDYPEHVASQLHKLMETDSQFAAAAPDPAISLAKRTRGLGIAQVVSLCMEGYGDRPALAERAAQLTTDPETGRVSRELLKRYDMISYRELWKRASNLASFWHHDADQPLLADDIMCILSFGGIDFVTVDLASIYTGAVVVPLQANAAIQQTQAIFNEVAPQWFAVSIEYLNTAVELIVSGHHPRGLVVFDYHPEVDDERERFEVAQAKLAAAGLGHVMATLETLLARGEALPKAPVFDRPDTAERLCTIYYTSGSTGLPKGAMLPERMVKPLWLVDSPMPMINLMYLPMNHTSGRSILFSILGQGGTGYFTGKKDLSDLFDDMRLSRPTYMMLVPRVCEMIYQQYQVSVERAIAAGTDPETAKQELLRETRDTVLGGRLLVASFASAPLAADLRQFLEESLGFKMGNNYGATEVAAVLDDNRVLRPPVIDYKLDDVPELGYFKTDKPYPRGELRVKTSSIMLGYYKRPDITAEAFDEEGYYKTGDIMAEIAPDRLIYVDRRNNVLKLAQGEFVAIARLEALFTNGDPVIRQVYLYGTSDRAFLVGVFVPNQEALEQMGIAQDARAIKDAVREAIQNVARTEHLQPYEVPRDFIIKHEPFSVENGLLAGIGKYQRPKFKERYAEALEGLYDRIAASQNEELDTLRREGRNAPVLETIARAVRATLGLEHVDRTRRLSFSDLGGDSLSALSFSLLLEEIYSVDVPASVINNPAGSLQDLERYIERARSGASTAPTFASVHGRDANEIRASDLTLDRFIPQSVLDAGSKALPPATEVRTVLLTGANGYLGRFLCLEWLERMAAVGGRVVCIARGQDAASARRRIAEVFSSDAALKVRFEQLADGHLDVLAGDIGEPQLGLSEADWTRLGETIDLIVHPAAFVNHVLSYQQLFGPNVVGTAEVIRLAITHKLKRINYVSTVAAAYLPDGILNETDDIRVKTPVRGLVATGYADGYANSKWAGEALLRDAHERFGLPVAIFRSDMILAHSRYEGQLNVPDMFTRLLLSIVQTGLAPKSFYIGDNGHYPGLPVDFTAEAIATLGAQAVNGIQTYHVINPHNDGISLDSFVEWAIAAGYPITRIDDYADWYGRFATALRGLPEEQRQHSSLPLLHQLQYQMPAQYGTMVSADRFRADVIRYEVGAVNDIPPLSRELIEKYLSDLKRLGLISE
ncbi:carboxylic acid reductase [Sphingobium vermicomposti]|uniref:Fatty acid CoA ligase FadD9 n=1 Tax=Sphingobium vermicomposti TaxID=529005 RepID=A0A846MH08_9SPHN|nr:carboxylic acid reductase [Sphingobium vermicomposti]NIJ17875.1 fatty acid CoA ligase FadD9 [Sphingobium vermicomposti]